MTLIFAFAFNFLLVIGDFILKERKSKKILLFLAIIGFSILACMRETTIPDTVPYINAFNYENQLTSFFAPNISSFETGFVLLTRFIAIFTSSASIYFFIVAMIILSVGAFLFSNQKHFLICFAAFMSFYGIYFSFVILRSGLSIVFFVLAAWRCDNRKILKVVFYILAIAFHRSAIIMLMVYLFAKLFRNAKLNIAVVLPVLLICLLCYAGGLSKIILVLIQNMLEPLVGTNLLFTKAYGYLQSYIAQFEFGLSARYVLNTVIYLITLYLIHKKKLKINKKLTTVLVFVFLGLMLESLFGNQVLIGRLTDFTNTMNLISLAFIIQECYNYRSIKVVESDMSVTYKVVKAENYIWVYLVIAFILMNNLFIYRICIR